MILDNLKLHFNFDIGETIYVPKSVLIDLKRVENHNRISDEPVINYLHSMGVTFDSLPSILEFKICKFVANFHSRIGLFTLYRCTYADSDMSMDIPSVYSFGVNDKPKLAFFLKTIEGHYGNNYAVRPKVRHSIIKLNRSIKSNKKFKNVFDVAIPSKLEFKLDAIPSCKLYNDVDKPKIIEGRLNPLHIVIGENTLVVSSLLFEVLGKRYVLDVAITSGVNISSDMAIIIHAIRQYRGNEIQIFNPIDD